MAPLQRTGVLLVKIGTWIKPYQFKTKQHWKNTTWEKLLQDAANGTLRSETLDETVCDAIIANDGVKEPSKKVQNVCDGWAIKHGSDFSCMCDAWHTVQSNELFAMRRNKRNRKPDEGVCDIQHTVLLDELFVIRQHKRNGQPDQGVCDWGHTLQKD